MTQRYSHLTPESLDATIRLLDNRPKGRAVGDNLGRVLKNAPTRTYLWSDECVE